MANEPKPEPPDDNSTVTTDEDGRVVVTLGEGASVAIDGDADRVEVAITLDAVDALNLEAQTLVEKGDIAGALAVLDRAAEQAPDHVGTAVNRAHLRADLGDGEGCLAELVRAEALEPGAPSHPAQRGRMLYALGRYEPALEAFAASVERGYTPDVFFEAGKCALRLARWEEAEAWLTRDIEEDQPGDISYWNRHIARREQGNPKAAVEDLVAGIGLCDDPDTLYSMMDNRCDLLTQLGQPEAAMAASAEMVDRFGRRADVLLAHGMRQIQQGDMAGAERTIDEVIAAEPEYAKARHSRVTLLEQLGRGDEAEADRAFLRAHGEA